MSSYDLQFVHEMVAGGDLSAVENLIAALFGELGSKIPSVRNPRRLNWFRLWRERLTRVGELPSPPASPAARIDPQEVDLCARRVVASGDPDAVELLLCALARELNDGADLETDRERKLWMYQAGHILDLKMSDFNLEPVEERDDSYPAASGQAWDEPLSHLRVPRALAFSALLFLLVTGLSLAALFTPRF